MAKTEKVIRDPLYNYVTIDREEDEWLLELIDAPEVQRLRRINQLGISHFTYPGADHSRLSHSLGVLHLMQQAWRRIRMLEQKGPEIDRAKHLLMAAAILHDVGHGPFSHLLESALGIDHESWSCRIIQSEETEVHKILTRRDIPIEDVTALITRDNRKRPPWQKTLLSSELDVDRLDYLRRDSFFTGAGYGHYDWHRILNSFVFAEIDGKRVLVWPEKANYAIEEYIFARFYMYNTVYQHKTTRGFEKLLLSAWNRAKHLHAHGEDAWLVHEIAEFLDTPKPTVQQYLALEDATVVYQLQVWMRHPDRVLSDLATRFLTRRGLKAIEDPIPSAALDGARADWEAELRRVAAEGGFKPPEYYALRDDLKLTVYDPYIPEKEEEEQDPYNAIFIAAADGGQPREISKVLERLLPLTGAREKRYRYYVPQECQADTMGIANSRSWRHSV
jgi:HD superfamily phosphohydrolase